MWNYKASRKIEHKQFVEKSRKALKKIRSQRKIFQIFSKREIEKILFIEFHIAITQKIEQQRNIIFQKSKSKNAMDLFLQFGDLESDFLEGNYSDFFELFDRFEEIWQMRQRFGKIKPPNFGGFSCNFIEKFFKKF